MQIFDTFDKTRPEISAVFFQTDQTTFISQGHKLTKGAESFATRI